MQKDSRRWTLRQRTAQAHQDLDDIVGDLSTEASYRRYLTGIASFRLAAEPALAEMRLPQTSTPYRPSRVAREVLADLFDLKMATPSLVMVQEVASPDAALGLLYVLEGSALGAQLLVKRAAAIGLTERFGARHLAAQTATLDNWRAYLSVLDAAEPLDMEVCVEAAVAAFESARTAFVGAAHA